MAHIYIHYFTSKICINSLKYCILVWYYVCHTQIIISNTAVFILAQFVDKQHAESLLFGPSCVFVSTNEVI